MSNCQICLFVFQKLLEQEKQNNECSNTALRNLVHQCEFLHNRLQECNINLLDDDKLVIDPSLQTAAFDLEKSDSSISLLLSKVIFCPATSVYNSGLGPLGLRGISFSLCRCSISALTI